MPATCRHCCSKQRKAEMNCLVLVSSTIHGTFFLFVHGLAFSFPPDHFCVIQHLIIFLFSIQAAGLAGWAGRSSLVLQARTKLRIILLLLQMARWHSTNSRHDKLKNMIRKWGVGREVPATLSRYFYLTFRIMVPSFLFKINFVPLINVKFLPTIVFLLQKWTIFLHVGYAFILIRRLHGAYTNLRDRQDPDSFVACLNCRNLCSKSSHSSFFSQDTSSTLTHEDLSGRSLRHSQQGRKSKQLAPQQ